MALQINERWESGAGTLGKDSSDTYSAIVSGDPVADNADDPGTIMLFACARFSVVSAMGNILNNIRRTRIAPGMWMVVADYRSPTYDRQTNDASFSFTVGGGTQHITHSIKTVQGYGVSGSGQPKPPNFNGCIGVDQDGSVAGTDIDTTTLDFRTTFYVSPANLQQSYLAQLVQLRGNVNSDTVTIIVDGVTMSFPSGQLRYRNADGSKRIGFGDWEFTLNWSALPNVQNVSVGPVTGISKNGWDYLWVLYQQQPNTSANMRIPSPIAAYVEQVYTYSALSPLLLQSQFGNSNSQGWTNPSPVNRTGVNPGGQ